MPRKPKTTKKFYKLGVGLIIVSTVFWIIPLIIPFLSFSGKIKAIGITGSLVIAEILFWTGTIIVGKEIATKYRSYLNPKNWRKRKREQSNDQ